MTACDDCLRRAGLLAALGPWFEQKRGELHGPQLALALPDEELVERLCGDKRGALDARRAAFTPSGARDRAAAAGMRILCRHAPQYPAQLAQAPDAPAALHLIGDAELLRSCAEVGAVAIVGSRKASPYGLEMAHSLGRDLAAWGVVVVSGMAYGIDSAAHEGALAAGGSTIAVMAGGADVATPPGKYTLHERVKKSGLVLSEMPPGMRPFRWSFPARNRIMAGLARMTVVVEGVEGSGSLITAGFAQDLGRDVGAVPGRATAAVAAGPNRLLAEGAVVVRSARDVLDALYGPGEGPPGVSEPALADGPAADLEPHLRRLLERIEGGVGTVDELAEEVAVADVLAGLSELELLGLVARGPGGDYARRA